MSTAREATTPVSRPPTSSHALAMPISNEAINRVTEQAQTHHTSVVRMLEEADARGELGAEDEEKNDRQCEVAGRRVSRR
jgi:hypothetical protein